MTKQYYSVGIDAQEAMLGSMDFYRLMMDTEAHCTDHGSDDDPTIYVLYESIEHRDAAYQAFRDRFRTARQIYSPHTLEVDADTDQDK